MSDSDSEPGSKKGDFKRKYQKLRRKYERQKAYTSDAWMEYTKLESINMAEGRLCAERVKKSHDEMLEARTEQWRLQNKLHYLEEKIGYKEYEELLADYKCCL
jgi:hypothetical protein